MELGKLLSMQGQCLGSRNCLGQLKIGFDHIGWGREDIGYQILVPNDRRVVVSTDPDHGNGDRRTGNREDHQQRESDRAYGERLLEHA